jgi:hypothetical protein
LYKTGLLRRRRTGRRCYWSGRRSRLRLQSVEHPQCCIHASLRGFAASAHGAKLRVAAAQEEAGAASGTVIVVLTVVIVPHSGAAPPVVIAVSVTVPLIAAFAPPSAIEIITISR